MDASTPSSTESLVAQVISTWRAGLRPDTAEVLARHPHLRKRQSLLLDLAYEEYCLRKEAGESLSPKSFCERFPSCRRSLGRLLAIHECANEDAGLQADLDADDVPWPAIDTELFGFQLLQELGRGAFARVYLARQPALGNRMVVVKVARYGSAEAETLGRLAHRNIVPVHSVVEDPETHLTAVCMPYLGSATLLDVLDVGYQDNRPPAHARFIRDLAVQAAIPQAVPEMYAGPDARLHRGTYVDGIVHLAVQLAEALQHTHEVGICHRDLKPSNVLLTPSGCPMLLDFNLSSDIQLERTFVGGTLPYMSPEQLQCMTSNDPVQDADGDPRSDLFSLGVILYELLTGHLPFGDRAPEAMPDEAARELLARQRAGCASVRLSNPQVSRQVAHIVHQCLALDPAQRPASAQALADALRRHFAPLARLQRWARRRWFLIGAGVVAAGLVASIVAVRLSAIAPYDVRHYDAGIQAFHRKNWDTAIGHFTSALAARPDAYQVLFARGQAYLGIGETSLALEDLKLACELNEQGCTTAWYGYALDCAEQNNAAEYYYGQATDHYGYEAATVWNNRGLRARGRANTLQRAVQYLTHALELDPLFQAAYHNRALAYAACAKTFVRESTRYGELAVQDIDRAVNIGPEHGALILDAAWIHLRHDAREDAPQRVVQYLQRALDLGLDRQQMREMSEFGDALLQQVADYQPAPSKAAPAQHLRLPPPNHFFPLFAP